MKETHADCAQYQDHKFQPKLPVRGVWVISSTRRESSVIAPYVLHETTKLPGYEQDDYVRDADFDSRNLADMTEEFATVRRATIQLFRPLNETE